MSGQGINHSFIRALPINYFILQSNQLSEHLLLPVSVEPLIRKVCEAFLISHNDKLR
jgi:hypothetical protein